MQFFYVKIPLAAGGEATGADQQRLHEQLEAALSAQGAGSLLGWGDSVVVGQPGSGLLPAYHRIDVEVEADPAQVRGLLRRSLAEFGVPVGSELHYTLDGQALQELYQGQPGGWSAPQPSSGALTRRRHRG